MKRLCIALFTLVLAVSISYAAEKTAPAKPAMTAADKKATAAVPMELIDINSATEAQLKAIPGIGDEYAKKVIAGRPFANKSQLHTKKIIPKPVYDKVKDMIIAKKVK